MSRRFVALSVGLLGAWTLAAGCSASGSSGQLNGPSYDLDAGVDTGEDDVVVPTDAPKTSPTPDGATKVDSSLPDSSIGTGEDATTPNDAAGGNDTGSANDGGGCTSTTAILGGNDFSLFGATATGTGAFATSAITGGVVETPALVAFGGGFEALFAEGIDASAGYALYGVGFSGGAWSAASALGGSASTIDAPAIAAVGATLQGVYLNPQHFYFQATFATAWDTGATPVRPPNDAGVTAFGPVHAAAAGTSTQLVIAYEGNNLLPYAQTWTSGVGWDDGVALGSAALVANTPMAIVALDAGASDLLAVYVDGEGSTSGNNLHLFYVARTAATKAWSAPAMVNVNAYTSGGLAGGPTLTAMSGGRALLAWQGQTSGVYGSVFTSGATPAWATPIEITSATPPSTPSLAQGVCGDDAVAAYLSAGTVYTTHFASGTWTSPAPLSGEAGMTAVSIATSP